MTWIVTILFLFVSEQALAGDLSSGGAISGAGQAMNQGLLNLQTGLIQQGLQEEQLRRDLARQQSQQDLEEQRIRQAAARQSAVQQLNTKALEFQYLADEKRHLDNLYVSILAQKGQPGFEEAMKFYKDSQAIYNARLAEYQKGIAK